MLCNSKKNQSCLSQVELLNEQSVCGLEYSNQWLFYSKIFGDCSLYFANKKKEKIIDVTLQIASGNCESNAAWSPSWMCRFLWSKNTIIVSSKLKLLQLLLPVDRQVGCDPDWNGAGTEIRKLAFEAGSSGGSNERCVLGYNLQPLHCTSCTNWSVQTWEWEGAHV